MHGNLLKTSWYSLGALGLINFAWTGINIKFRNAKDPKLIILSDLSPGTYPNKYK